MIVALFLPSESGSAVNPLIGYPLVEHSKGPPAWMPAAVSQPNMLAQFGTQNDAAAFLHAAAAGNWQLAAWLGDVWWQEPFNCWQD